MKERYPFKEEVIYHQGKWTTMERCIQHLRELALLEVIFGDLGNTQLLPKDSDELQCTQHMWWKVVQSVPPLYGTSLAERSKRWRNWLASFGNMKKIVIAKKLTPYLNDANPFNCHQWYFVMSPLKITFSAKN